MTYVVVELCVDCKYTDCAAVCPVEAFHELPDRLYINADTCIDCDACVPECPVEAIFADTNVPEQYKDWTQVNIDEAPKYPILSQKIPALHGPTCLRSTNERRAMELSSQSNSFHRHLNSNLDFGPGSSATKPIKENAEVAQRRNNEQSTRDGYGLLDLCFSCSVKNACSLSAT